MKNDLIDEALDNIRADRKKTKELLSELKTELISGTTSHAHAGTVAAKYVETLQRSNEQLVKIINIFKKEEKEEQNLSLSEEERDNIFDIVKETA